MKQWGQVSVLLPFATIKIIDQLHRSPNETTTTSSKKQTRNVQHSPLMFRPTNRRYLFSFRDHQSKEPTIRMTQLKRGLGLCALQSVTRCKTPHSSAKLTWGVSIHPALPTRWSLDISPILDTTLKTHSWNQHEEPTTTRYSRDKFNHWRQNRNSIELKLQTLILIQTAENFATSGQRHSNSCNYRV